MEKSKKNLKLKKSFFENGYLIIKRFANKKTVNYLIESINKVLEEAITNSKVKIRKSSVKSSVHRLNDNYMLLKTKNPKLKARVYDKLKSLLVLQGVFSNFKLIKIIEDIIGTPAIVNNTQIKIDDPSNDRLLNLHQELDQLSLIHVTAWLPLQNLTTNKYGGLRFIPKSHKNGFIKHKISKFGHIKYKSLSEKNIFIKNKVKILKINSGDLLLFHPLLIHGSLANKSKKVRLTAISRFNGLKTLRIFKDGKQNYAIGNSQKLYGYYNTNKFTWK